MCSARKLLLCYSKAGQFLTVVIAYESLPLCALLLNAALQNDTKKLAEAKQLVYLKGFTDGVMVVGEHAGKKVRALWLLRCGCCAMVAAAGWWYHVRLFCSCFLLHECTYTHTYILRKNQFCHILAYFEIHIYTYTHTYIHSYRPALKWRCG
jgi:hypothetical protein